MAGGVARFPTLVLKRTGTSATAQELLISLSKEFPPGYLASLFGLRPLIAGTAFLKGPDTVVLTMLMRPSMAPVAEG